MKKQYVYVVIHEFYSHDMFIAPGSGEYEEPTIFGVYRKHAEAKKHLREDADDSIVKKELK